MNTNSFLQKVAIVAVILGGAYLIGRKLVELHHRLQGALLTIENAENLKQLENVDPLANQPVRHVGFAQAPAQPCV